MAYLCFQREEEYIPYPSIHEVSYSETNRYLAFRSEIFDEERLRLAQKTRLPKNMILKVLILVQVHMKLYAEFTLHSHTTDTESKLVVKILLRF